MDQVAARDGIRDLVARYNLYGDSGKSDRVAALFTEGGSLEYREDDSVTTATGRREIAGFLERIKARWLAESVRSGLSPRVFHSVGTHVIDVEDEESATGTAYVSVMRSSGLAEWGLYRDRYVHREGRWQFASRRASVEGRIIGGSLGTAED